MPSQPAWQLEGKRAWITGASRGIGFACADVLAQQGCQVVGFDLEPSEKLNQIATRVELVDVASFDDVTSTSQQLIEQGLGPDILINNAGIARDGVIWKMSEDDFDSVLDVSLKGAFNFIRHVVPYMREKNSGSIVNMTSINGLRGKFGQSNYSAAKAGLIGLTKSVAREVGAFGIRVNAIAPGMVETEMTRDLAEGVVAAAKNETLLRKLATPDDIANAVAFFASPLSGHITGQILSVDGGQYL